MHFHALQHIRRIVKYLVILLAVLYGADWGVFKVQQVRGTGLGSVVVESYLKTPLKGNKAEYDYLGTSSENCSQTAFPQYAAAAWNPPCWWLKRHNQRWQ